MATMMSVPPEYGYVIATVASTFFLNTWHGQRVNNFRKAAGIKYPKPYADSGDMSSATAEKRDAMYLLNCAQRAHGNFCENHPSAMVAMLIAGVQYPMTTTALSVGWVVGRIVFALGYTRKDKPEGRGRYMGSFYLLCQAGLFGLSAWSGIKMVL